MSFWSKLESVDARIIYLILWIAVGIPLLTPLYLPLSISPYTVAFHKAIESLPAGSVVVFGMEVSPAGYAGELGPQSRATAYHLFTKPVKVIFLSYWETGAPLIQDVWKDPYVAKAMQNKKYGEDYVNLGWIPGSAIGMAAFAQDVWKTVAADYKGTKLADLPIMANIKSVYDITMLIVIESGSPGGAHYLGMWQARNRDLMILVGSLGVSVGVNMPFVASGQYISILRGGRGAAEYQRILNIVTPADAQGADAMTMSHVVVLALLLVGNISYLALKGQKSGEK